MVTVSQITTRPLSGVAHVDALIGNALPWNYLGRNVLYYSFSVTEGGEATSGQANLASRAAFNGTQQAAVREALAYVAGLTGIQFAETGSGTLADLHFANADLYGDGTAGLASNAWSYTRSGEQVTSLEIDSWVYLDHVQFASSNLAPAAGSYGWETLLHEIGHALGLKHPFEGAQTLPAAQDNTSVTLMSYTRAGGPHTGFGVYDVAALDWLFGRDGLGGTWGADTGRHLPLNVSLDLVRTGTAAGEQLTGGSGNDTLTGLGGDDLLNGANGIDTAVFMGRMAEYSVTYTSTGYTVSHRGGSDGTDTLVSIERLEFSDARLAIDVAGHGGQAYRLYQAAFDRVPDLPGLGYQMNALDTGLPLREVAAHFIASPEFAARYGTLNDVQFVTQLYANVLERAPDAGGLAYHTGNLASGYNTRADVLVGFSESPENQLALIGSIQNGMRYT